MARPQAMEPRGLTGRMLAPLMERAGRRAREAALAALALQPAEKLLEVGFGTGALLERAERGFAAVVAGVDPSALMVAVAKKRLRGEVRQGICSALPWPRGSFDAAAAVHCFEYFANPGKGLAELARVLRPGGRLVMVLRPQGRRGPAWLPNRRVRPGDETGAALQALERAGFAIETGPLSRGLAVIVARRSALPAEAPVPLKADGPMRQRHGRVARRELLTALDPGGTG